MSKATYNSKDINNKLYRIPAPKEVMAQIGVVICNLPEVDRFKHIVVAIDYLSKWSEAKPFRGYNGVPLQTDLSARMRRNTGK